MLSGRIGRIFKGIGAGSVGTVLTVIIQLVSIPLFLSSWGDQLYGEWLVFMTLPAYFAMSDFGFGTSGVNEMAMLAGANKKDEAVEVFQSIMALIFIVGGFLVGMALLLVFLSPVYDVLSFEIISKQHFQTCVLFIAVYIMLSLQLNLVKGAFRCENFFTYSVYLQHCMLIMETAILFSCLALGFQPLVVVEAMVAGRVIHFLVACFLLRHKVPWIQFGLSGLNFGVIKKLFEPSVTFLGFPVSNAILQQVPVMMVSHVLGASQVVVWSTTRTLVNMMQQVLGVVLHAIWPEFSRAFGEKDYDFMRLLHRKSVQFAFWITCSMVVFLALTGPEIIRIWTNGQIEPSLWVLLALLLSFVLRPIWYMSMIASMSTNNHSRIGRFNIVSASLAVGVGFLLLRFMGLPGLPLGLFLNEVILLFIVLPLSFSVLNEVPGVFFKVMLVPPRLADLKSLLSVKPEVQETKGQAL